MKNTKALIYTLRSAKYNATIYFVLSVQLMEETQYLRPRLMHCFLSKSFSLRFLEKVSNATFNGTHDCYFLFNTFFSYVNNIFFFNRYDPLNV